MIEMKALQITFWYILDHLLAGTILEVSWIWLVDCGLSTVDACVALYCLVGKKQSLQLQPLWCLKFDFLAQFLTCRVRRIIGYGDGDSWEHIYVTERSRHNGLYPGLMNSRKPWGCAELYQFHKHYDGTCRGSTLATDEESNGDKIMAFESGWQPATDLILACLCYLESWYSYVFFTSDTLTFWSKVLLKHHIRHGHGMGDLQTRCEGPWRNVEQKQRSDHRCHLTSLAENKFITERESSCWPALLIKSNAWHHLLSAETSYCWATLLILWEDASCASQYR